MTKLDCWMDLEVLMGYAHDEAIVYEAMRNGNPTMDQTHAFALLEYWDREWFASAEHNEF